MNPRHQDLDTIQRILLRYGSFGFVIRFWIFVNVKSIFGLKGLDLARLPPLLLFINKSFLILFNLFQLLLWPVFSGTRLVIIIENKLQCIIIDEAFIVERIAYIATAVLKLQKNKLN